MTHTYQIPTFYLFVINILAPAVTAVVIWREVQFFQDFSFPAFSFWSALPMIVAWGGSILLFGLNNLYTRTQDKFIFVDDDYDARLKEGGIDTLQEFGYQARFMVGIVVLTTMASMGYTLYYSFTLDPQDYIPNVETYRRVSLNFNLTSPILIDDLYDINDAVPILFDPQILSAQVTLQDGREGFYTVPVGRTQAAFENRVRTVISLDNQIESMKVVSFEALISLTDPRLRQLQYYIDEVDPENQTFVQAWDEQINSSPLDLQRFNGKIDSLVVSEIGVLSEEDLLESE